MRTAFFMGFAAEDNRHYYVLLLPLFHICQFALKAGNVRKPSIHTGEAHVGNFVQLG